MTPADTVAATPEILQVLGDAGSAVIIVFLVIYFLRYLSREAALQREADEKRDKQWQDFFKAITSGSDQKMDQMGQLLSRLTDLLERHDQETKTAITTMIERTRSRPHSGPGKNDD